jgi:hypothetical protein
MTTLISIIAFIVIGYLVLNGRRNSDPLNRKCAAEICEYLVSTENLAVQDIHAIFQQNARYRTQANHVLSMVPSLLMRAGYPRDVAFEFVPLLRAAAAMIPR